MQVLLPFPPTIPGDKDFENNPKRQRRKPGQLFRFGLYFLWLLLAYQDIFHGVSSTLQISLYFGKPQSELYEQFSF